MNPTQIPVFILAGGLGTRMNEDTQYRPKPMVEVGEVPVLVHLMRWYYRFGFNDFIICGGYKSWEIKRYFLDYKYRHQDLDLDFRGNALKEGSNADIIQNEKWRVRVLDTGQTAQTGARIARALKEVRGIQSFDHFAITYGDGLSNVPLDRQLQFHLSHGRKGTVLGVHPVGRFGELYVSDSSQVLEFREKHVAHDDWVNGGFFFFRREFENYLQAGDICVLEREPLARLAREGELMMYEHDGFWHPMDTQRDRSYLQGLWDCGQAAWRPD